MKKVGGQKTGVVDFYKAHESGSYPCPKCSLCKVVLANIPLFRFRIENIFCHEPDLKSAPSSQQPSFLNPKLEKAEIDENQSLSHSVSQPVFIHIISLNFLVNYCEVDIITAK